MVKMLIFSVIAEFSPLLDLHKSVDSGKKAPIDGELRSPRLDQTSKFPRSGVTIFGVQALFTSAFNEDWSEMALTSLRL